MAESLLKETLPEKSILEKITPLAQSLTILVSGLGSLAALFVWIGNVIIISRLREYNLYGIVHYTDEYVREAGFQFLQDVFSFFSQPALIALAVALVAGLMFFMPVGPFEDNIRQQPSAEAGSINRLISRMKRLNLHYFIFFLIALSMTLALALDWGGRKLAGDIMADAATLQSAIRRMDDAAQKKKPPAFIYRERQDLDKFQARFIEDISMDVRPTAEWVWETLRRMGYAVEGRDLQAIIDAFQQDFGIPEQADIALVDTDRKESATFRKLKEIHLSERLNAKLYQSLKSVHMAFMSMLQGNLDTPDDYTALALNPANFGYLNDLIKNLLILKDNIGASFDSKNAEARGVLADISGLTTIRLGSSLIVASFLTMLGLLTYLLMNATRIRNFDLPEKGYYFLILLLFITISITLPAVYGRYNFEFKIQRITDVVFNEQGESAPLKQRFDSYLKERLVYVLGPTRDKEVIVSTMLKKETGETVPQIIVMDRTVIRYMHLEPVSKQEIPALVKLLKRSKTS